jgi:predicted helicase
MGTDHRAELARIHRFDQLIRYLRDEMGWPIASDDFEELTFDYTPEELGINAESAAKIQEIKRLRPLSASQPWGIFFVKFEPKNLPVVALRRILSQVALKKRASANAADRAGWAADDLLFVSNYGQYGERKISFAHFARPRGREDLPTLKVLGWDNQDTPLHLDAIARELTENLAWPQDENDADAWRQRWRSAFTLGHREAITTAERLSIRLAELAGAIRDRIRSAIAIESSRGPLTQLMKAFQESLVHDLDAEGFADMYAQTISYGLLSSRIADPSKKTADDFAAHMRTSPFLKELMQTFLKAGGRKGKSDGAGIDFDELGVADVVELLDGANMEAVLRDFGDRNRQEDPVIHFFEGFLQAYDKKIRKDRGVFYTPQPVVSYIVRSVHELLQTEFGLADGLADTTTWGEVLTKNPGLKLPPLIDEAGEKRSVSPDEPFVQILDPATGTATFLVEVIDVIHRTLLAKWKQQRLTDTQQYAAWNDYVPKHLLPRLHAYELMMAPYAIAHMKIGLKLAETGYRFAAEERARIFLTNALEPWVSQLPLIGFDALAHEAAAVNDIKRNKRFTVVIGNPPYAGLSSNMTEYAQRIVDAYKIVDGETLNERKLWLQDDYVKFIRKAQTTIERAGVGVFGFITNHGYFDNPTFRGMRQSLMGSFRQLSVLDLHGNANKKEISPDGTEDKNVFDIKQGVGICLATSIGNNSYVRHADLWGSRETKYTWLGKNSVRSTAFSILTPDSPFYLLVPQSNEHRQEYEEWMKITEAMPVTSAGFITARDRFVIDFDRASLAARMKVFADQSVTTDEVRKLYFNGRGSDKYADGDTRGWKLSDARRAVQKDSQREDRIRKCLYRPFDERFIYWANWMIDWPRPEVMGQMIAGDNLALITSRMTKGETFAHAQVSRNICEVICMSAKTSNNGFVFPLWVKNEALELDFQETKSDDSPRRPNFSHRFTKAIADALNVSAAKPHSLPAGLTPEDVLHYIYAVFHSPSYRSRYSQFLRIDFPRLPLTGNVELFHVLAQFGRELTSLHLLESPEVNQSISKFTGRWDTDVEKISWSNETVWIDKAQSAGFVGVREEVWNFHVGGYQVCEKWLKDRKGRTLSKDDIAHYQKIVLALSETIRLLGEIDKVIDQHGGWPDAFSIK